ncbi:hypothetical protein PAXRUDRAFT_485761 [Paxillus rubicundulus Ve08.2h10]|uniref:Unplaced genomic scaffold scaffold_322, whole genome shotgun sequence n=1 Tax=Paxillus rubicundulus Ve08.2h10 TaxID=930991 RepID=A0A0D0D9Y8_9AGAM|nr:hypothetical protein PAXRUDRAFT_485761 [Paxillus rubicundulus Ve08.2h10]
MVLKMLGVVVNTLLPSKYYVHAVVSLIAIVVVHAFSQGRATNRERDMHARVVLVTGAFTPLGLTLVQNLAERGAHVIALSPKPIDHPEVEILIELLRSTTKNEQIYAEACDLSSPASVRSFCTRFLTGKETRLDAIIFTHEYQPIGSLLSRHDPAELAKQRRESSLATFLIIALLLPLLLVAPVGRDIRIINVVNPFYAAASRTYSITEAPPPTSPLLGQEGRRSLEMIIFTRHLQRVLDALPSGGQIPKTDEATIPVISEKVQKSNIVAVSVCPGISRADTVAAFLDVNSAQGQRSMLGIILYVLLHPFLRLLTKSQPSAVQSILHVLFLPTPFKSSQPPAKRPSNGNAPEEVLKAGALYRECAVVNVRIPTPDDTPSGRNSEDKSDETMPDDRELGGVHLGQSVWECFEVALKEWDKTAPSDEQATVDDTPSLDIPDA